MIFFEIIGLIVIWSAGIFILLWILYGLVKTEPKCVIDFDEMPKLHPKPIPTKKHNPVMRILVWLYAVREWRLLENWIWEFEKDKFIVIPKDFEFDGPSIPRIFWFILSPVGLLLIPGLVHDYGYRFDCLWMVKDGQLTDELKNMDRDYWDLLFKEVGEKVNGLSLVDWIAWKALVFGGTGAWKKHRDNPQKMIKPQLTLEEKEKFLKP